MNELADAQLSCSITCSYCGRGEHRGLISPAEFFDLMKRDGWRTRPADGYSKLECPECAHTRDVAGSSDAGEK